MLALIAALFLVPLAAAFWLYYGGSGWRPPGATNQGELVVPPRSLPPLEFAGADGRRIDGDLLRDRWTLLYVGDARCDERCRKLLYLTRQTRIALNQDAERVRRVFLATGACCAPGDLALEHPDLVIAVPSEEQLAVLSRLFTLPDGVALSGTGRLYVVDPLGNLMMSYPAAAPDKALLIDLKRLLRLSHIG